MLLKSFGKNTVIYGIGNIFLRGTALMLLPIYTHALSVRDYGLLSTLLVTIQFMLILMNMGMRVALVRFARTFESQKQMASLIGTSVLINFVGGLGVTLVSALLLLPLFRSILHTDAVFDFLLLTCISSLVQSLFIHIVNYYRARNEAFKFTLVTLSATLLLMGLTLAFLFGFHWGIKSVMIAQIIAHGSVLTIALIHLTGQIGFRFSWPVARRLLRFGFPLIFSITGQSFTAAATMYFLSFWLDLESVAIFSLSQKLSQIMIILLIVPFQLSFQPFIFANLDKPAIRTTMARIFTYLLLSIALLSIFILIGCRIIFPFIAPPEYAFAYRLLLLILPATGLVAIVNFAEALLNIEQKTFIQGIVIAAISFMNLILNYLFIPWLGLYGAVLTLFISNFAMAATLLKIGLVVFPIPLELKRIAIILVLMVTFICSGILLQKSPAPFFYGVTLALPIMSCIGLYFFEFWDEREKQTIKSVLGRLLTTPAGKLNVRHDKI